MIKKLQNNFTTPEQSERLLELGVPADSADCYTTTNNGRAVVLNLLFSEFMENIVAGGFNNPDAYLPCWSVGRLIEIFITCTPYVEIILRTSLIEQIVASYEDVIKQGMIDFSKLEE